MDQFLKDRENYLKNNLKNLELEYLKLIKIQQKRESIKVKVEKSLSNCINILQRYATQETHSPNVTICRKDFANDHKDLLEWMRDINQCSEETFQVTKTNDYHEGPVSSSSIDMGSPSILDIFNLVNIRLLDDRLTEMHQLSIQLKKEVLKYNSENGRTFTDLRETHRGRILQTSSNAVTKEGDDGCSRVVGALDTQITSLESSLAETLKLNMLFPTHESPSGCKVSYESFLRESLRKHTHGITRRMMESLDQRMYDICQQLSADKAKYLQGLKTERLKRENNHLHETQLRDTFLSMTSTFKSDLSSKVGPPLKELSMTFSRLNKVASNASLKMFLEQCRLQMPLLRSFLKSYSSRGTI